MLGREPDLKVIGEAKNGRDALELCRRVRPDLVLMDVRMPDMDGLAATRAIKQEFPHIMVLIVTSHDDPDCLAKALKAGAVGYVLKEATQQQLLDAIRGALKGESPLNQELSTQLLLRLISGGQEEEPDELPAPERPPEKCSNPPLPNPLSPREVEVLKLLARGQTNQQISRSLLISTSTVKKHVHQLVSKLKVCDRTHAAIRAYELGLLTEGEGE